jgi:hypothetical protein
MGRVDELERAIDVPSRPRSSVRILREERLDEEHERLGHRDADERPQVRCGVIDDPHPDAEDIGPLERPHAGDALEEDDAKAEEIGPGIDAGRVTHLFWRHVERRSEHGLRRRSRELTALDPDEPEVEELGPFHSASRQVHVARPQVAMHAPEPMRMRERPAQAQTERARCLPSDRSATEALLQILAFEPLHREIHPAGCLSVPDVPDNGVMIEPRERLCLAAEARP